VNNKFVTDLLPNTIQEFLTLPGTDKIRTKKDLIQWLALHKTTTPRTPDWIRSHGMCLEHLIPGRSRIAQAGQGGFAQHHIRRGEMVVPVPMVHIVNRELLQFYDKAKNRRRTQLLLNYCFGHSQSSLLLCPQTNAILLNHCSSRTKECGPEGPNAEFRWSSGWEPSSDEWRTMTIDQIANQTKRGLSMEVVAVRDIAPGEEVFADYGIEWEKAWQQHVASWKPPSRRNDRQNFVRAKEANEQTGSLTILVAGDLREKPRDKYLFTGCQYWTTDLDEDHVWEEEKPDWETLDDAQLLERYADDGSFYHGNYSLANDKVYWPCSILKREGDATFLVRIHQSKWHSQQPWDYYQLPRLLTNYPRNSIQYFVRQYKSDQFLPGAFRHHIGIPDKIFPPQWKNLQ
jgi:hypothetical protein